MIVRPENGSLGVEELLDRLYQASTPRISEARPRRRVTASSLESGWSPGSPGYGLRVQCQNRASSPTVEVLPLASGSPRSRRLVADAHIDADLAPLAVRSTCWTSSRVLCQAVDMISSCSGSPAALRRTSRRSPSTQQAFEQAAGARGWCVPGCRTNVTFRGWTFEWAAGCSPSNRRAAGLLTVGNRRSRYGQ